MAEERNVGLARATDTTSDEELSKEDLQRRMEEARESLTQTVNEIKDTVTTQYQTVRENINDALDWREQVRKQPAAFSAGALAVGFLAGYGVASGFSGGRTSRRSYDYDYDDDNDFDESDTDVYSSSTPSYVKQSSLGGASRSGASGYGRSTSDAPSDFTPSYVGSTYDAVRTEEPEKPGLLDRFKETQAFDRLQSEVSTLGDRFVDELSNVAKYQVLPAVLGKVKEMFGIDLSDGGQQNRRDSTTAADSGSSYSGSRYSSSSAQPSTYGQQEAGRMDDQLSSEPLSSPGSASTSFDAQQQGSSYGTSPNKDYGQP